MPNAVFNQKDYLSITNALYPYGSNTHNASRNLAKLPEINKAACQLVTDLLMFKNNKQELIVNYSVEAMLIISDYLDDSNHMANRTMSERPA